MKTVAFFLLLVAAAVSLPAQEFPMFAWWDSPLARDINLTDAQREQIRSITREYRDRLIESRAEIQKLEARLDDVMAENTVDLRQAEGIVNKLVDARGVLMRNVTMMSLRLRTVLSKEQWQELQRRRGDRRMGPMMGAPGGLRRPGGRGPGRLGEGPGPGQPSPPGPPPEE